MDSAIRFGDSVLALLHAASLRAQSVFAWYLRQRWWLRVGIVWALGRIFSFLIVVMIARQQGPNPWTTSSPDYFSYADGWDAKWYDTIVQNGYPTTLPLGSNGLVTQNQWAFYPVFPYLAKALGVVTGLSFQYAGPLIATVASLGLCLVLYRLFRTKAAAPTALFAVALFSFQPAAPILQFGYAESLGILMLAALLLFVIQRRFLLAIPLSIVLCVTRPTNAPIALGLFLVMAGWWIFRKRTPVPSGDWWKMILLIVITAIGFLVWPVVTGIVTHDPKAYFETEASWHGRSGIIPGQLWYSVGVKLFGHPLGALAPVVFVIGFALIMLTKTVRRLGPVMWLFTVSYVVYLIGVSSPNGSLFRLMMPAFPLMLSASMASNSKAYRVTLIALSLILQIVWVGWLWQFTGVGIHGQPEANP